MKKKDFKKLASIYKQLALGDMSNGVSKLRFEKEIEKQAKLENYEACEGLKQAINKVK